jgi:hypothetical protein
MGKLLSCTWQEDEVWLAEWKQPPTSAEIEQELRDWWAKVGPVHSAKCNMGCPYHDPLAIHPPGFKHGKEDRSK